MECKDCKFWKLLDQSDDEPYSHEPYYDRDLNSHYRGYGECEMAEMHDGLPVIVGSLAVAADAETYRASLYTAPNFACNQFQPK